MTDYRIRLGISQIRRVHFINFQIWFSPKKIPPMRLFRLLAISCKYLDIRINRVNREEISFVKYFLSKFSTKLTLFLGKFAIENRRKIRGRATNEVKRISIRFVLEGKREWTEDRRDRALEKVSMGRWIDRYATKIRQWVLELPRNGSVKPSNELLRGQ